MIQGYLGRFLTNVVTKWNAGQKMALFMLFMSLEVLNYLFWMIYIQHSSYAQQHVNITIINQLFPWACLTLGVVLFCGYLFHFFQKNEVFTYYFQLFVMLTYTVVAAYIGYLVGQDNIMSAIAISTAGLLIVLFCERTLSYWIVSLNLACMFGVMYAAKTGILPASEFYIGDRNSAFWVYSYLCLCGLKVMVILIIADNMLYVLKRSYKSSKYLSEYDALTGLPNRKKTQDFLIESLNTYPDVSLVMIDLDYFKQVNDTFGHLFGDSVLASAANLFRENLRENDLVGRYGGEEFVMILPDTNMSRATQVAQDLLNALSHLALPLNNGDLLKPTASFGVVGLDFLSKNKNPPKDSEQALKRLFEVADEALYFAKDNGRDQVVAADRLPPGFLESVSEVVLPANNTTHLKIVRKSE